MASAAACRGRAEQWLEPVELCRSGDTRVIADLREPDAIELVTQELVEGAWRALEARPIVLRRASVERLIVAVGFR